MGEAEVEIADETGRISPELLAELDAAARLTLSEEGAETATLSIALVGDGTIATLNEQYLSHSDPTDVISFPLEDPGGRVVGDIYVGVEQAARQAGDLEIALREELIRLVVHGTLHVLGWEHPEDGDREASDMYRRQEALVGKALHRA